MTELTATPLRERIADWRTAELEIDRQQRLVRNIALAGLDSRNGYRYAEPALRQAVPLYDGKPVFLDHAVHLLRPQDRSTRDLVGSIIHPRFEQGRVRGDIQTLDTEAGRTFLALAASDTPAVGMSHVVLARRNRDGTLVEQIDEVISVDAVVFPATTANFREQTSPPPPGSCEAILRSIDEQLARQVQLLLNDPTAESRRLGLFPDAVLLEVTQPGLPGSQLFELPWNHASGQTRLGETLRPIHREQGDQPKCDWNAARELVARLQRELEELKHELQELRRQLAQYEQLQTLLDESGLPGDAVTDCFRRQLLTAPDPETQRALIADRRQLLGQRLRFPAPHSRERLPGSPTLDDQTIIQTIRRRAG